MGQPRQRFMAVARMRKVTIFAFQRARENVLKTLRDLEIMHVTATKEGLGAFDSDDSINKLAAVSAYMSEFNPMKKGFIEMFTGQKPEISADEFERVVKEQDVDSLHRKLVQRGEQKNSIAHELAQIRAAREVLLPWEGLDVPLRDVGPTRTTDSFLAVVPSSTWEETFGGLLSQAVHWEVLWQQGSRTGLWIIAFADESSRVRSLVSSAGGSLVDFQSVLVDLREDLGLAADILERLNARETTLKAQSEEILAMDRSDSEDLIHVLALADHYADAKNLEDVGERLSKTRYTLMVEGYVKEKDVPALREAMSQFEEVYVVDEEPENVEEVPVYLENHPIIRPFEVITNIFGFPRYDEVDPTPVLAPFFWVFFGICLGDAVYGILLSLGAWYFLRTQKLSDDKLVKLLMYSGISTFFAGALMGSWLGDLPSVFFAGSLFDRLTGKIALINPVDDPLTLLVISVALGIFQIWVGIIMKMYTTIKEGDVKEGILSHGSWVLFLPGLAGTVLGKMGVITMGLPYYVMIAGALMVMYSSSRGQKIVLLKPFAGVFGFYDIVGYFSDALSYSRLLALGLASAIIGVVVNKMADLVSGMIPIVGWGLVPFVLLGGHLFNLVINVLGSFIHSGRLQFVEFFTKFFEGGGRQFKPLKRVSDHVSLG